MSSGSEKIIFRLTDNNYRYRYYKNVTDKADFRLLTDYRCITTLGPDIDGPSCILLFRALTNVVSSCLINLRLLCG